jgi:hypothetical protein
MKRLGVLVLAVTCLGALLPTEAATGVTSAWTWRQSGAVGGGYQNVVAADPRRTGKVIVGGELSGFHRSSDAGNNWTTSNLGLRSLVGYHVATLTFSKALDNTVYAAGGAFKGNGTFLASTDGGASWDVRAAGIAAPQMSSLQPGCGSAYHPRATGNLIALDEGGATKRIYIGSLDDGVMRSTDGGRTWQTIALKNAFTRTLIADPSNPSTLYAGVCSANGFSGAYKITGAGSATPVVKRLTGAPSNVEEFAVVGGTVYAAAGSAGIYKVTNGGDTWTRLGASFFSTTSMWSGVDGYVSSTGKHVLYVACAYPVRHGNGMYRSVAKSTDGGATWQWISVDPTKVHYTMAGTTTKWWLAPSKLEAMFGRENFETGQIIVDPLNRNRVFVTGRAGIWRSDDGGVNWYPAVNNLGAPLAHTLAARGTRMLAGVTDWTAVSSTNYGATVTRQTPGQGTYGFSAEIAPNGSVYLGPGHKSSNSSGGVYVAGAGGWANMNLPTGGKRVAELAVGVEPGGGNIVMAAVQDGGLWRKSGTTSWQQVASPLTVGITDTEASMSWPNPGEPYVYLVVPGKGLFRSIDRGKSWTKIWTSDLKQVAGDPSSASGRIYVYGTNGIYRLDSPRSGTVDSGQIAKDRLPVPGAGPIAVDGNGVVYVAGRGTPAGLYTSADQGKTWTDRADALYRASGAFAIEIALSADGRVYVALKRNGVIVGRAS